MLNLVGERFPILAAYLPDQLALVGYGRWAVRLVCHTTHPALFEPRWALNPEAFALLPVLPRGFFAIGVHASNYERLFVMWARQGRRFHFTGLYFGGGMVEATGRDLYAEVGQDLSDTLARWERSSAPVVSNCVLIVEDLAWLEPVARQEPEEEGWCRLPPPPDRAGAAGGTSAKPGSVPGGPH